MPTSPNMFRTRCPLQSIGKGKYVLVPKFMFAKRDKQYPSRSLQTSLATAVTNFTKPVTNINFGPSTFHVPKVHEKCNKMLLRFDLN